MLGVLPRKCNQLHNANPSPQPNSNPAIMDANLHHDVFRVRLRISSENYLWTFRVYADQSSHLQIQRLDANGRPITTNSTTRTLPFQPFCVLGGCHTLHLGTRTDSNAPSVYACRFDLAKRSADGSTAAVVRVTGSLSRFSGFQGQIHPMSAEEQVAFEDLAQALGDPPSWNAAVDPVRVKMVTFSCGKYTSEGTLTTGSSYRPSSWRSAYKQTESSAVPPSESVTAARSLVGESRRGS